jgi:hypothetical protein
MSTQSSGALEIDEDNAYHALIVAVAYLVELLLMGVPFWKAAVVAFAASLLAFNGIGRGMIKIGAMFGCAFLVAEWLDILPRMLRR